MEEVEVEDEEPRQRRVLVVVHGDREVRPGCLARMIGTVQCQEHFFAFLSVLSLHPLSAYVPVSVLMTSICVFAPGAVISTGQNGQNAIFVTLRSLAIMKVV